MKKYTWNNLTEEEKQAILARPLSSNSKEISEKVKNIIQAVRSGGDEALLELTTKYDQVRLDKLKVAPFEFDKAQEMVSNDAKRAIEFAKQQIETNHQAQLPQSQIIKISTGVVCERQARPIERIGLYIPGGSAPLVSTVLMLGVPAKLANCSLRIICTPPNANGEVDPHILFAAKLCGIREVYKVGGAQAIAAMAYGTQTIPKVDKIFGPGNAWVTQAKLIISQDAAGASIDMPAGPSEVMVIADETANPEYVAADLLSQAEHGLDSQVMLVTTSSKLASDVGDMVYLQLAELRRYDIAKKSLTQSRTIIVDTIQQAIAISNAYAPEHLIMQVAHPQQYVSIIVNAGAVFLGKWAPETVGDYVTGSNHVLPTYGYAKSYSGLSTTDFMKFINFQTVTREGLYEIGPYAEKLAEIEGLDAHRRAVTLRLKKEEICNE